MTDVEVTYGQGRGRRPALGPLSLSVGAGEFLAIVGASGCGKTTLLNCIGGTLMPTEGQVAIDGVRVTRPLPQIGTVFQKPNLYPWLTVRKNVVLGLTLRHAERTKRHEIADSLLSLMGLPDIGDMRPYELSGGMQQRVAIARAFAISPQLLLMDEPFGALDAMTRERLQKELRDLTTRLNPTVVFITHDVDEAIYLGDRVVVMGQPPGRIEATVDTSEVTSKDDGAETRSARVWLESRAEIRRTIEATTGL